MTDREPQFTGQAFVEKLRDLGAQQRFGAIGRPGSIAVIERLRRTLKEMLDLKYRPPLSCGHLEEMISVALNYSATLRPHQGLDGATPAEIHFRLSAVTLCAVSPPRAMSRDPAPIADLPFALVHADPDRRLPFLIPRRRTAQPSSLSFPGRSPSGDPS